MFETIAVATDGSEGARRAVRHARTLAEVADATVVVVTVADARQSGSTGHESDESEGLRLSDRSVGREPREDADTEREVVDERANREAIIDAQGVLGDDLSVETDLRDGVPHEEILAAADDHDVDLVVMGTHGRTGLDRPFVGSTTERVVRLSDRPVLTVGPDADAADGYRDVLVPTDGSGGVEPAVEYALDVAEAFGATVHGLFVADVRAFASDDDRETDVPDAALDALEERGANATARIAERATARGLDAETDVVDGVPTSAILDYAADRDVDLVVMGTHGRTGFGRLLLGSVAETVIRKADCPVLTVRRTDEE